MGSRSRCLVTAMTVMHIGVTRSSRSWNQTLGIWIHTYIGVCPYAASLEWTTRFIDCSAWYWLADRVQMCKAPSIYLALKSQPKGQLHIFTRYSWATLPVPGEFLPLTGTHLMNRVGPSAARGGPGMAAIIGPGGPITLLWTVRVNRFWGGAISPPPLVRIRS